MGLLSVGTPLSWKETKHYADHVRYHGIQQFINLYNQHKDRTDNILYFGDELEYTIVKFDEKKKKVRVCLKAQYYLEKIADLEAKGKVCKEVTWTHEYASYMLEGTPGKPYGPLISDFKAVEENMVKRRQHIQSLLDGSGETIISMTVFPRLGCPSFTVPQAEPQPRTSISRSIFYPDEALNNVHPRFKTMTNNIRERRGEKVVINVPIYVDSNTPQPWVEDLPTEGTSDAKSNHIYMDTTGFGLGCSCLQITQQAFNIAEARRLYDQLTPLTPILMALSAASPIYRGYLADIDHRWNVLAASVDDRTSQERGESRLTSDRFLINKSRYSSVDCYISEEGRKYNDIPLVYDEAVLKRLIDAGVDDLLAQHFAHLFIRDSISLFAEKVHIGDEKDTDHFENIQSTNWRTMRFKPPPANSDIGWRVEFRPIDCQLTDFENAAFTVFVVMLTRVISSYNLNMLIPISKVDENIKRAEKRDAVLNQRFHFKKCVSGNCSISMNCPCSNKAHETATSLNNPDAKLQELTIDEIINGHSDKFTGLIPFIIDYMDNIEIDVDTRCTISRYLDLISKRASGQLKTTARFVRDFVGNHPDYKGDSVISEQINYDLIKRFDQISKGQITCLELLPAANRQCKPGIPKTVLATNNDQQTVILPHSKRRILQGIS